MKKLLLPAFLLLGASFVNAQKVVIFEEDFEWIEPWLTPAIVDNIADNDHYTGTPALSTRTYDGKSLTAAVCDRKGNSRYWFTSITKTGDPEMTGGQLYYGGAYSVYCGANWLKFGKTGVQAGFRFQSDLDAPEGAAVTLEFDWCPWRQSGKKIDGVSTDITNKYTDGKFDPVQLQVFVGDQVAKVLDAHDWEDGHDMEWIHATVDLDGFTITRDTRILIRLVDSLWGVATANRYCLDNLKMSYDASTTGINEINADENAPAEYYNLQGVRVNNPENGLYICRQGNKVSKIQVK